MNDSEIKVYMEKLFEARLDAVRVRLDAMDQALALSQDELQRRFHQVNELRREVMEDRMQYARKDLTTVFGVLYALALLILTALAVFWRR